LNPLLNRTVSKAIRGRIRTAELLVILGALAFVVVSAAPASATATPGAAAPVGSTAAAAPGLTDIAGNWAESEISQLYAEGIVSAKTGTEFRPADRITRAEFCVFVAGAVGLRLQPYAGLFQDVPATLAEATSIEAANRAGIVQGTGLGRFSPSAEVTREQMAAMLLRAYLYATKEPRAPGAVDRLTFNDNDKISDWAVEPVMFAVGAGLMQGKEGGFFAPGDATTRAEAAVMIFRLLADFPSLAAGRTQPAPPVFAGSVLALTVAPSDPGIIYAGGGEWGGIIKSTDGGRTWTNLPFNTAIDVAQGDVEAVVVDPRDPNLVTITTDAAGAWPAGILQSRDGGRVWERLGTFQDDLRVHGVAVLPSGRYVASSYGGIRFAANGANWRWATDLYLDPLPSERSDAAAGRADKAVFGFLAADPTDGRLVLAPDYYGTDGPPYYYSVYISRNAGWSWDGFLTADIVKPGPFWRAIAFPPGGGHTLVVGTDLYDPSDPSGPRRVGSFIDESTIPGLSEAYLAGADGKRLRVVGYSFAPGDRPVFYALASATTRSGTDVTVILRSGDGGRTWTRHEAVLPEGASPVTAMAVSFSPEAERPDSVFLADLGRPADPSDPAHNLVGHIYRASAVEADGAWTFQTVYTNRKPQ